jgi:hypothetical protein
MDEIKESNKDLDMHSTHLMKKSRELNASPSDMEELKMMPSLDKDNNDLNFLCKSALGKGCRRFRKRCARNSGNRKVREEVDYVVAAKKNKEAALEAKMEARRERAERIRSRETEMKKKQKIRKSPIAAEKENEGSMVREESNRAGVWYNKLSPSAKEVMQRIAQLKRGHFSRRYRSSALDDRR